MKLAFGDGFYASESCVCTCAVGTATLELVQRRSQHGPDLGHGGRSSAWAIAAVHGRKQGRPTQLSHHTPEVCGTADV